MGECTSCVKRFECSELKSTTQEPLHLLLLKLMPQSLDWIHLTAVKSLSPHIKVYELVPVFKIASSKATQPKNQMFLCLQPLFSPAGCSVSQLELLNWVPLVVFVVLEPFYEHFNVIICQILWLSVLLIVLKRLSKQFYTWLSCVKGNSNILFIHGTN